MASEDTRRIARRLMRNGYTAEMLGQFSDAGWAALRELIQEPDVPDLTLADAVDTLALWEAQPPRPEVVDNPYAID